MSGRLVAARSWLRDLPDGLARHCARTAGLARRLALVHGMDPREATEAAWLHDVARHWRGTDLLGAADALGLPCDAVARRHPILLHGPVGAALLLHSGVVEAGPVCDAICWHTSCRPEAGPLELLVFVADKLEPAKLARAPELAAARRTAEHDLGRAAGLILEWSVARLEREGSAIQPVMLTARDAWGPASSPSRR